MSSASDPGQGRPPKTITDQKPLEIPFANEVRAEISELLGPGVSDEKLDQLTNQVIVSVTTKYSFFSGPLPRPDDFAEYERHCPGAAERIIRMAERQQEARIDLQTKESEIRLKELELQGRVIGLKETELRLFGRRNAYGLSVLIALILFCALAVWRGHVALAGGIITLMLASIGAWFFLGPNDKPEIKEDTLKAKPRHSSSPRKRKR